MDIAIVDYGMGNLRSVEKALAHVAPGARIYLCAEPAALTQADRVVFPGQGAMPDCIRELEAHKLRAAVLDSARSRPFLGICVGAQLLLEWSEEGSTETLGLFPGRVRRFPLPDAPTDHLKAARETAASAPAFAALPAAVGEAEKAAWPPSPSVQAGRSIGEAATPRCKVPHMGWNAVYPTQPHPLWSGIAPGERFYFVHSYYLAPTQANLCSAYSAYPTPFVVALAQGTVFATQFHPEKSHRAGLQLLRNFVDWEVSPR